MLPVSPSWREAVSASSLAQGYLDNISAYDNSEKSQGKWLIVSLKQGANTRLHPWGPSLGIILFSLCAAVIYSLSSTLHEAAGRGDWATTSPFPLAPLEECESDVRHLLPLPGAGNLCNSPALKEWFTQVSTDAHRGCLQKFSLLPLHYSEDIALAELFTCRPPWVHSITQT